MTITVTEEELAIILVALNLAGSARPTDPSFDIMYDELIDRVG
jgi:hypothetical protein